MGIYVDNLPVINIFRGLVVFQVIHKIAKYLEHFSVYHCYLSYLGGFSQYLQSDSYLLSIKLLLNDIFFIYQGLKFGFL